MTNKKGDKKVDSGRQEELKDRITPHMNLYESQVSKAQSSQSLNSFYNMALSGTISELHNRGVGERCGRVMRTADVRDLLQFTIRRAAADQRRPQPTTQPPEPLTERDLLHFTLRQRRSRPAATSGDEGCKISGV